MKIIAPILTFLLLLSGCSGIPYETNKSNAQIAEDLKISENGIKVISKCNYYPFTYGIKAYAKMRSCVFVENDKNIYVVNYDSNTKAYFSAFNLKLEEVNCAAIAKEGPGKGIVYLYTDQNAFTIALLHQNNDMNHEAVRKLTNELVKNSIPILDLSISIANPLYKYKTSAGSACPITTR